MKSTTYTARQGIFNRRQHLVAYELLFRNGVENVFPTDIDGHQATSQIIINTHLNRGIDAITNGLPAFINFSETCLHKDLPLLLPHNKVVVEILETVTPSDEVFLACRKLFHAGYTLALDDFVYSPAWARFIPFVKLIKFDLAKTPLAQIAKLVAGIQQQYPKVKLLAERIETQEQFQEAKAIGFHLFQGYFFCKPEVKAQRDVQSETLYLLKLVEEASRDQLDIDKVCALFSQDVGLTYKLLTYINSGVLPLKTKIKSIRQALVYLGIAEVRKLILLLATGVMAQNKPKELTRVGTIRAKGSELIAKKMPSAPVENAFMTGLLSIIDAILDMPMEEVLNRLPLCEEVKSALLNPKEQTPLRLILNTVVLAEQGSWHLTTQEALKLNLSYKQVADAMQRAQQWTNNFGIEHQGA